MTKEKYEEIKKTLESGNEQAIDAITEAERKEYNALHYLEVTDNKAALDDLRAEIRDRRDGYIKTWATGFNNLDDVLDGGFEGGQLIFLGAISSLGKTSFALQMATQIAEQGNDVLIFSLEMSKNELNAKNVSRYMYIESMKDKRLNYDKPNQLATTKDVIKGKVGNITFDQAGDRRGELYLRALEDSEKIADHIFIYVGNSDIDVDTVKDVVEAHIAAKNTRPFVILDYLQILQPSPEAQTTDKRLLTDYDVTRLKCIARDFNIPVLAISAFNRTNYLEPVNMGSFRESSGIEYSSDVLLAMQYQGMDYQKHRITTPGGKHPEVYESTQNHTTRVRDLFDKMDKKSANGEPILIELKVLKNRLGTRKPAYFEFLPAYNYYSEQKNSAYEIPPEWLETWETENPFTGEDDKPRKVIGKK